MHVRLCTALSLIAAMQPLPATSSDSAPSTAPDCCKLNLWTGEGVSIGNFLLPEFNYQATAGSSTTSPESLASGHHDPDRHGITQQNIEISLGAWIGQNIRLFGTYAAKIERDDRWRGTFEEYYAHITGLPWDATLRGGRLNPTFGYQQTLHPHHFVFVDQYLASGRLIGEDSLAIYGGEITIPVFRSLPAGWDDKLAIAFGAIPDADDDHHAHSAEEALFEGEGAHFQDWVASMNYTLGFTQSTTVRIEGGVSGAWGRNNFGRLTQLYGAHLEYLWRADGINGHFHGVDRSEYFRWRTEVFVRHAGAIASGHGHGEHHDDETEMEAHDVGEDHEAGHNEEEAHDEHEEHPARNNPRRERLTDAGFYTALSYGFPGGKFATHLRGEYVSGIGDAGLPERWRISPAISWHPSQDVPITFKLQYNYDHAPSFGDEHSIWLQINLRWGDCCAHPR